MRETFEGDVVMRAEPYKWMDWALREDAPEDIKKEFEEFQKESLPDEDGIITLA